MTRVNTRKKAINTLGKIGSEARRTTARMCRSTSGRRVSKDSSSPNPREDERAD